MYKSCSLVWFSLGEMVPHVAVELGVSVRGEIRILLCLHFNQKLLLVSYFSRLCPMATVIAVGCSKRKFILMGPCIAFIPSVLVIWTQGAGAVVFGGKWLVSQMHHFVHMIIDNSLISSGPHLLGVHMEHKYFHIPSLQRYPSLTIYLFSERLVISFPVLFLLLSWPSIQVETIPDVACMFTSCPLSLKPRTYLKFCRREDFWSLPFFRVTLHWSYGISAFQYFWGLLVPHTDFVPVS